MVLNIDPAELDRLALTHDDAADQMRAYGQPNHELMASVLETHGDVAASLVTTLDTYYARRSDDAGAAADDHAKTASDLRVSRSDYIATDQAVGSGFTRSVRDL
ncbi:ESX-1 secretion-associated protein [Aldersonia sp. NBC_00410]|uniref:type VII secretion target n=1 Tax=Aldersonia sp. NBC_00410 TaxID=2975954 RepID=UPI00224E2C1F|nr:type VII secretion target [Aldersonia sp. NBC_00410]MCX5046282.1 ESX-1 secretion-associated protein [Aldersonia sp. NBC_00410]